MKFEDWLLGAVFPFNDVGDGRAEFTEDWVKEHDEPPASFIVRRKDGTGKTLVLRAGPAIRPDDDKQIAISNTFFKKIAKTGEEISVPVRFRPAGFGRRVWYRPTTRLELVVAVLAFLAAVATGTVALINGLVRQVTPGAPSWLLIVVFFLLCAGLVAKLLHDVKKADQA